MFADDIVIIHRYNYENARTSNNICRKDKTDDDKSNYR